MISTSRLALLCCLAISMPAQAQDAVMPPAEAPAPQIEAKQAPAPSSSSPSAAEVDQEIIDLIRKKLNTELVFFMLKNQNEHYKDMDDAKIAALDAQWVSERKGDKKPLITATLTNPLSSYLTMVQAHSKGLFTELFVMDAKGLNVGQSNISSDYWQGDEAKWQKTYQAGPTAIFIDEPEFDEDNKFWIIQTSISIADPETGNVLGAATIDINLTELERRRAKSGTLTF